VTISRSAASHYVRAVLSLYVRLPGTRPEPSRQDRRLAATLHDRGIPLAVVEATIPEMRAAMEQGRVTSREIVLQC